jgi:hypothetical protein
MHYCRNNSYVFIEKRINRRVLRCSGTLLVILVLTTEDAFRSVGKMFLMAHVNTLSKAQNGRMTSELKGNNM